MVVKANDNRVIVVHNKTIQLMEREEEMYNVIWKDVDGVVYQREFDNLNPAMEWAKILNQLVTIKGNGFEIVGVFGADSVENGLCPDGIEYSWKKRRR